MLPVVLAVLRLQIECVDALMNLIIHSWSTVQACIALQLYTFFGHGDNHSASTDIIGSVMCQQSKLGGFPEHPGGQPEPPVFNTIVANSLKVYRHKSINCHRSCGYI